MWVSTDGASWELRPTDDGFSVASLAERDGVLYAITTAPATSEVDGAVSTAVGLSDDGGTTWQTSELPLALDPPEPGVETTVSASRVVSGDAGVLAVVNTATYLALDRLIAEVPDVDLTWGYLDPREDGVHVFAPYTEPLDEACAQLWSEGWREEYTDEPGTDAGGDATTDATTEPRVASADRPPHGGRRRRRRRARRRARVVDRAMPTVVCTFGDDGQAERYPAPMRDTRTVPYEELGLDSDPRRLLARGGDGDPHLFVQTDGSFVAVESPFPDDVDAVQLVAVPGGFLALAFDYQSDGPPAVTVWRSSDGLAWEPSAIDPIGGSVRAAGVVDGTIVMVTDDVDPQVVTSADGVSWRSVRLRDVVGSPRRSGTVARGGRGRPGRDRRGRSDRTRPTGPAAARGRSPRAPTVSPGPPNRSGS